MKKQKAISIIQKQIDNLKLPGYTYTNSWIVQTRLYIDKIFGENSYQSKYLENFDWTDTEEYSIHQKITDIDIFLKDCKKTVLSIGTYKSPKNNFLSIIPDWLLSIILPALIVLGTLIGKYLSDVQNIELKRENVELKEKLKLISFDSITNKDKEIRIEKKENN